MQNISKVIIGIIIFFLHSCTDKDYYTLSSPDKLRCVTLEYSIPLNPNDSIYVKLYSGAPPVDKKHYVKMLWSNIGGVAIDWDSYPLKVRSWLVKENTFPEEMVDVKMKMTKIEKDEFHSKKSLWKSYDFTWVSSGKYENCSD